MKYLSNVTFIGIGYYSNKKNYSAVLTIFQRHFNNFQKKPLTLWYNFEFSSKIPHNFECRISLVITLYGNQNCIYKSGSRRLLGTYSKN